MFSFIAKSVQLHYKYREKKPGCKIEQHFTRPEHTINDYSVLGIVKLENPPRGPTDKLR